MAVRPQNIGIWHSDIHFAKALDLKIIYISFQVKMIKMEAQMSYLLVLMSSAYRHRTDGSTVTGKGLWAQCSQYAILTDFEIMMRGDWKGIEAKAEIRCAVSGEQGRWTN